MALASNIQRRAGSARYYARLAVPKSLQAVLGRKEVWKSLGTSDPLTARAKALPVLARWHAEFAELQSRREPSAADVQGAVWSHYEGELERDHRNRAALPTGAMVDAATTKLTADIEAGRVEWSDDRLVQLNAALGVMVMKDAAKTGREQRAIYLAELRKHLGNGETALIAWAADDVIERERLLIDKGSQPYRDLCQRLQRAQIEALERAAERDAGNWAGMPADPIVVPPDPTMGRKHAAPGETIMELYTRFEAEKKGSVTLDTWTQNRVIVGFFVDYLGATSHVTAITRKAVRDWKHQLSLWPVKATSIKAFAGMSFRKIVEANATLQRPTISQNTINRYLSAIAGFVEWLFNHEYIDQDAMRGMFLSIDKGEKKRFPFTAEQLQIIFSSPLFSTCLGDGREHLPGNATVRDWRYWIPFVGLYTGARLGEIAQLLTADVRQLHGIWVFHITREGSTLKSTKTAGSMRVVPVHRELIRMGFIDYHAAMIARGESQLFPEIEPDARGFFSGEPSKFFNAYFRDIGVKVDRRVNFHSFRHGIADAFRGAGYLDEQFNMLLGHTKATTTGRYGIMPEGILSERVKMIEAVCFASITI